MIPALLMMMASAGGAVEREGMRVAWHFEPTALVLTMAAPTTGWVTVGFNAAGAGLSGARLVMTRVSARGRVEAEEHLADPPRHARVAHSSLVVVSGEEAAGRTAVTVRIDRDALIAPGRAVHLVLAYSAEDDFMHHSRVRTSAEVTL